MIPSDAQVIAFTGDAGVGEWRQVVRPVGRQRLPSWVRGAHVDWRYGYSSPPDVCLKVHGDVYQWDNQRWAREGSKTYITRHEDGRARVLYHDGARTLVMCWRVFIGGRPFTHQWQVPTPRPGESLEQASLREGGANLASVRSLGDFPSPYGGALMRSADADLVVKPFHCTTRQDGFGGDAIPLAMVDGSDVLLRGPWHGGPPDGLVEVTTYDASQRVHGRFDESRPWFERMGTGGLYITEDLFTRILSAHAAHVELAQVHHRYGWRLEPYDAHWGVPKALVYELEAQRAEAKQPAGPNWRVFWDTSRTYCGSPCPDAPPYGFLTTTGEAK